MRKRADVLLVERELAANRSRAQALLLAGRVYSGPRRIDKAGELLPEDAELRVRGTDRYVSRGGTKLEGALVALGLHAENLVCVDIGASTGGFTDCLLQHGAARVFAVDVGHGQLDVKLRGDARVVVMERTNARYLTAADFEAPVDLAVVDASFISLELLLPAISALLGPGGRVLALIKPQFEAGKQAVQRGRGVIRDPAVRDAAIAKVRASIQANGFELLGECDSTLPGPKGNLERFVLAAKRPA